MVRLIFSLGFVFLLGQALLAQNSQCTENPDPRYKRGVVYSRMISALKASVEKQPNEFKIVDERPAGFFIYDLTDTSNKSFRGKRCIEFIDGHIYHFAPGFYDFSKSFIAFLQDGGVKIFSAVDSGDSSKNTLRVLEYYEKTRLVRESPQEMSERALLTIEDMEVGGNDPLPSPSFVRSLKSCRLIGMAS